MSFSIDPIDNGDLYDSVLIAGVKSPGKVTLSGHNRKVEWDVKGGPGISGGSTTIKGIPAIEFTATFSLVRDDALGSNDFDLWPAFVSVIESSISQTAKPKALDIYHPDLASQNPPILSVCKAEVGGVIHDGKGGQTIAIKFQEYRPARKVAVTPQGSLSKKTDPDAARLAVLDALVKQNERTPWG